VCDPVVATREGRPVAAQIPVARRVRTAEPGYWVTPARIRTRTFVVTTVSGLTWAWGYECPWSTVPMDSRERAWILCHDGSFELPCSTSSNAGTISWASPITAMSDCDTIGASRSLLMAMIV